MAQRNEQRTEGDLLEKLERLKLPVVKLDGTVRGGARKRALEQITSGERVLVMTTPEIRDGKRAAAAKPMGPPQSWTTNVMSVSPNA